MTDSIGNETSASKDVSCFLCGKPALIFVGFEDDGGAIHGYPACYECLQEQQSMEPETISRNLALGERSKQNMADTAAIMNLDERKCRQQQFREAILQVEKYTRALPG